MSSLELAPGLAIRLEALPDTLSKEVSSFLRHFPPKKAEESCDDLVISADRPPQGALNDGAVVLEEEGLVVRVHDSVTLFEAAGIVGWCESRSGKGGIASEKPSRHAARSFVGLALAPLILELTEARGWFGVHAAAVAVDGLGIVLPGSSGVGKSTIFRHCHRSGFGTLSDDLVWLREGEEGAFLVFPFPRGFASGGSEEVLPPSLRSVAVKAIVCPSIVDRSSSDLVALGPSEALDELLAQSGFLGDQGVAADRFRALVRLADSVPCHRLEAGRRREDVPKLLRRHAAKIAASSA